MADTRTVEIPEHLFLTMEKHIKDKDFDSVDDYVVHILKQVASRLKVEGKSGEVMSREDEEEVKKRLKTLGYL